MDKEEVRIIDISPFLVDNEHTEQESARKRVLEAWTESFQKLGFAIIVGHGVPTHVTENLYNDSVEFFSQPQETKMKANINSEYGAAGGGYTPMGIEAVNRSKEEKVAPPDIVESFIIQHQGDERDVIPENPKRFRLSIQKYATELKQLLRLILKISSLSLGMENHYFESLYQGFNELTIRLAFYPAQDKKSLLPDQMRYGAHTDYTGFTILRQDEKVGGLEVKGTDGCWVPVHLVKNSFVVNAGDFIQMWTNDFWISNWHRVVNPPKALAHLNRMSIVYFTGPHPDAIIKPQEHFCDLENPPRYEAVKAIDHLNKKLKITNV